MPTARDTAPPGRPWICSPTDWERWARFTGVIPSLAKTAGGGINGKVVGRDQHAGRNQGHDGHEAFHQHGAVADKEDVPFVADHLRSGAGADDGMESGQGAAGDGNKDKGKDRPGDDGTAAADKLGDRFHEEVGPDKEDPQGQGDDGADLEVGGEIIPGAEEQPDRQHRGNKAVNGDEHRDLFFGISK